MSANPSSERFSRQEIYAAIGRSGQEKMSRARVAVLGCGALGSVVSEMLVRAGIGTLKIIDRDYVELSNLQRQSLFSERHARESIPKAVAAGEVLHKINSEVKVECLVEDINPDNIRGFLQKMDLMIDGSDNFELRFLINDYSVCTKKAWIYGAALGSYGISFPVMPGKTPCLRCYYSAPPPAGTFETCESAGILSPIIHVIAANQFTQAVKYLIGTPVSKAILQVDIWNDEWRTVHFDRPVPDCICCAERDFEFLDGRYRTGATLLCGRNAIQITPEDQLDIDLREFAERFDETQLILFNKYLMKLSLGEFELTLFKNGRAMVKGTDDPSVARSLYSRFIGC